MEPPGYAVDARPSQLLGQLLPTGAVGYQVGLAAVPATLAATSGGGRAAEYAAGRACAHEALRTLGVEGTVGRNADRSPAWPTGVVGSIAHCGHLAVAAAAPASLLLGLGVDVEDAAEVSPELVEVVLTPAERALAPSGGEVELTALLFSVKESVYKAWYPRTGVFLDYPDIEVALSPGSGGFTARVIAAPSVASGCRVLTGRYLRRGDHVASAAWAVAS